MKTTVCFGQPSWKFSSDKVAAAVTQLGGHLAPVRFRLPRGTVQPFSIAPWAEEKLPANTPPLIRSLRGDFFCAPFGGNETVYRGESHPAHGDSAQASWHFESLKKNAKETELHLSLRTRVRPGRIDKTLRLRQGETAIYSRHILSGMSGRMSPGHHATLKFPALPGSGHVSMSPIRYAQVLPIPFENAAQGGYSALKRGATFSRLDRVPCVDGSIADLSRYPARRGYEDLVMVVHEAQPDFAWTAVTFPKENHVWFALKDPRVLRSTVMWMSNGGRHYAPWSSRHVNVMGLEDVTAYFHCGLAESAQPNPVSRRGFPTSVQLSPKTPLVISYIMAVAAVPRGFERVKDIKRSRDGVTLISTRGQRVAVSLDVVYLQNK